MFKAILLNAVLFSFFSSIYIHISRLEKTLPSVPRLSLSQAGAASGLHLAESWDVLEEPREHQGAEGGERDASGLFKASLWSELECVCMIFS